MSTVDSGHQREVVTPSGRHGPIWGSRGRRFKSRQPDNTMANCHAGSDPRSSGHRAILDKPQCQGVGPRSGTPARVRHSASRTLLPTLGEWTRVLDQVKAFEPAGSPRTGSKPPGGLLPQSEKARSSRNQCTSVHVPGCQCPTEPGWRHLWCFRGASSA
jgi:hypothetical protein